MDMSSVIQVATENGGQLDKMNIYLIDAIIICAFIIFCLFYVLRLHAKYLRQARNGIRCEFRTPEGNSWPETRPVIHGVKDMVRLPPITKGNQQRPGKMFIIDDESTYMTEYPEGWCPGFIRVKMRKAIIRTDTMEPISRLSYEPIVSPEDMYNIMSQKYGELGVTHSELEIREQEKVVGRKPVFQGSGLMWVIIIALLIGVGVMRYILFGRLDVIEQQRGIAMILPMIQSFLGV